MSPETCDRILPQNLSNIYTPGIYNYITYTLYEGIYEKMWYTLLTPIHCACI